MEFLREAKAVGDQADRRPGGVRRPPQADRADDRRREWSGTLVPPDPPGPQRRGWRNLLRLSSKSFLEGFYYKPRIDKQILEQHAEGLICLSGCASAEFSDHLLHGKTDDAERLCAWYQKIFGEENFYVEIQDNGISIQRECKEAALDVARRMGLPVVATSDAHYLTKDDAPAHDILLCINTGKTFDDPNRMKFENDQFHVRSPEEMYAAMPGHEEALANSARIAEMVEDNYKSLNLGTRHFPAFKPPGQDRPRTICSNSARKG